MTRFHVAHRKDGRFEQRGLRNYFEYRDLGIRRATKGKVVAHVIRARPGKAPHGEWHYHAVNVQFVYVLKGWVLFEYQSRSKVMEKAGRCFEHPPGVRHRQLKHPPDVDIPDDLPPPKFNTAEAEPRARKSP